MPPLSQCWLAPPPHIGRVIELSRGGTSPQRCAERRDSIESSSSWLEVQGEKRRFPAKTPMALNLNDEVEECGGGGSSDASTERSVKRMEVERAKKRKKIAAREKNQVKLIQAQSEVSGTVIRDKTGRTGMLKKFPSLKDNDDKVSNQVFLELSKVVQKYQAHLPLGSGKKEVSSFC